VTVRSTRCADFRRALVVHGFECEAAASESASEGAAGAHSPLYQLFAKSKFDGYLGVPPVGRHSRDAIRLPPLRVVEVEADAVIYRGGAIEASSVRALASAPGGIAQVIDSNVGMEGLPHSYQLHGIRRYCPLLSPGGVCCFDSLFPQPEPKQELAEFHPTGGYAALRDLVKQLFSVDVETAAHWKRVQGVIFMSNNCAVLWRGSLQQAKGPDPPLQRKGDSDDEDDEDGHDLHDDEERQHDDDKEQDEL